MMRILLAALGVLAAAVFTVGGAGAIVGSSTGSGCIAHRPAYIEDVFEPSYTADCSGHDEPELDPISSAAGLCEERDLAIRAADRRLGAGVRRRPDVLVRRDSHRPEPEGLLRRGLPRGPVLPRRCPAELHAERRLRARPRGQRLHGVHAGVVDSHDRPEAGLPRAGGVQRDADHRVEARADGDARRRHGRPPLPPRRAR